MIALFLATELASVRHGWSSRLTAYAMRADALPAELDVMLGTSSHMAQWGLD